MSPNLDARTVEGFGQEWTSFDQAPVPAAELDRLFDGYFRCFPWDELPSSPVGFDAGCGSGRWAARVAPSVGALHCVDASPAALKVAEHNLAGVQNCEFHHASVDSLPFEDGSMDFGYALGVLHHLPDTVAGLRSCVRKLKPGAPLLIYLYYAFDNRPAWYRALWRVTDGVRRVVSRWPHRPKIVVSSLIALTVYWPLARAAWFLERRGVRVEGLPLAFYRDKALYTMLTDAYDRFGTRLERRFTRAEIVEMMGIAGLERVVVSDELPYWCAVGYREDPALH